MDLDVGDVGRRHRTTGRRIGDSGSAGGTADRWRRAKLASNDAFGSVFPGWSWFGADAMPSPPVGLPDGLTRTRRVIDGSERAEAPRARGCDLGNDRREAIDLVNSYARVLKAFGGAYAVRQDGTPRSGRAAGCSVHAGSLRVRNGCCESGPVSSTVSRTFASGVPASAGESAGTAQTCVSRKCRKA